MIIIHSFTTASFTLSYYLKIHTIKVQFI